MDLIERYIYAVIHQLPPRKRADAETDLRNKIDALLIQRVSGQPPQPEDIDTVLRALGDPRKMADKYRGSSRYLIGPVLFETYWLVLKIALPAVSFAILLATAIKLAVDPPEVIWQSLGEIIGGLYNALLGAFGIITLIFALLEYFNVPLGEKMAGRQNKTQPEWQPGQLPAVPRDALRIKRSEPIVAIIFTLIFLIVINVNLNLIGIYIQQGETLQIIPLFSDLFRNFLPWINLSLVLSILVEVIKLISGRWTLLIVTGSIVQKIIALIVGLETFTNAQVFNYNFFAEISRVFQTEGAVDPASLAATICKILIIVIIVGFVIDVLTTGWKAVRIMLDRRK